MNINQIYNENCLDTMKRMPDNFIDLTVTSPPYDNLRTYKGYEFPFEEIAKELFRVTKKGGVVVWVVGDATINGSETGTSFKQALYFMDCGFNLHDTMILAANKAPLTHNRYEQCFDYMFVFSKYKPKTFNPIMIKNDFAGTVKKYNYQCGTTNEKNAAVRSGTDRNIIVKDSKFRYNIWWVAVGSQCSTTDEIAFLHPAIFPESIPQDHIKTWSNECDLIYDPFGGSGTTAKMAHLLKRNWIMSEISQEYCEIAEKRIKPYLMQQTLF